MFIPFIFCLNMAMHTTFGTLYKRGKLTDTLFAFAGSLNDNRFASRSYILCCSVFLVIN